MFENNIIKWNHIPTFEKQDGYETLIKNFPITTKKDFNLLSQQQKDNTIKKLIKEIRKINIFPVFYFNEQGIKKEILSVINKQVIFQGNILSIYYTNGSVLLDYLFPNIHHVKYNKKSIPSIYERFFNDSNLYICLKTFLQKRNIYSLRTAFFSKAKYLWNTATNYLPLRAKAIYERYCPKNGIIYDYSAGFGGRMLGALSSNYNFKYIAVQPNSETYNNLLQLGKLIENITNRKESFKIYKTGSENFVPQEKIDFAFSCPPFFDLEIYSDQKTQSIVKFPEYYDWLENYVRPTIKNCYSALKDNGLYAVDLMNYLKNNKKIYLIQDWMKIAKEQGFFLADIILIDTKARKKGLQNKEQLLIFSKNKQKVIKKNKSYQIIDNEFKKKIEMAQKIKRERQHQIAIYDINGNLIKSSLFFNEIMQYCNCSKEDIKNFISSKKRYKEYYFRKYSYLQEIPVSITVKKVICKIDNQYFHSYAEVGKYTQVSRQAVQQAKKRNAKQINSYNIIWL